MVFAITAAGSIAAAGASGTVVVAPTAIGSPVLPTYTENTGTSVFDMAPFFTDGGGTLSYSLSGEPTGVTISGSGVITVDTDVTGVLAADPFDVIADNGVAPAAVHNLTVTVNAAAGGPMAFEGYESTFVTSGSGSPNMVAPAGIQAGDLLILFMVDGTSNPGNDANRWNTPSGWQGPIYSRGSNTSDCTITAFYKIATGSEGNQTVTWTGNTNVGRGGFYVRISNPDTGSPLDQVGADFISSGAATSVNCPSITTSNDGGMAFAIAARDGSNAGTWTPDNGFTLIAGEFTGSGSNTSNLAVAYKLIDPAGAVGVTNMDWSASGDGTVGMQISFNPAP